MPQTKIQDYDKHKKDVIAMYEQGYAVKCIAHCVKGWYRLSNLKTARDYVEKVIYRHWMESK